MPDDQPWPSDAGCRGPTPYETRLGRLLAIFGTLSKLHYQKANIYIRTMGLAGTLGTERVMGMLREIEGMQQQRALEGADDVPDRQGE
jgi:hypothetical protein